jgi:adenylosuccinate synthase
MAEVFNKEVFDKKIRRLAAGYAKRYGSLGDYDVEKEIKYFDQARIDLAPFVTDGFRFMQDVQKSGAKTIVEGANVSIFFASSRFKD